MTDTTFASLGLAAAQLHNLGELGYHQMTPIQAAALPHGLAGKDLLAQAKTGSGKTAAFALPLLQRLDPSHFGTQALVLCPTRELATQVAEEIRRLARYQQNIKVVVLCGGQSIGPQIGSLAHGAHIVVGTPGRICDHLRKQTLNIAWIKTLVLDEADRMLQMGFIDDISSIIAATPSKRQTMLFSATYPADILALSAQFQRSPERVTVESQHSEQQITQHFYLCDKNQRSQALAALLQHYTPATTVVFCNTRQLVNEVCETLQQQGISALGLHGEMEQRDRDQVLIQFKHQSCLVLVATDVAARGLDIDELGAVINYHMPRSTDVYVHRIGRTGRAGHSGLALSLLADNEVQRLSALEEYFGRSLDAEPITALTASANGFPKPSYTTLCIAGGRKNKLRPGDILGALTGDAGLPASTIGKITVADYVAYVSVESSAAATAYKRLLDGKIKGRRFKLRKLLVGRGPKD